MTTQTGYSVTIDGVTRELPTIRVGEMGRVPLVELLGDVEFTNAVARELVKLLPEGTEVILTVSTSSIPLGHAMSELSGLPYVVVRKKRRTYLRDPLIQEVADLTLGTNETLWLDGRHAQRLKGKRVAVMTDVIASGGTVMAMARLAERAGGQVAGYVSAFCQGTPRVPVRCLHELPTSL